MKCISSIFLFSAFAASLVNGQLEGTNPDNDPNDPCTVCTSGETPNENPTSKFFTNPTETTCTDIISMDVFANGLQGDVLCKDNQLLAFQLGCCAFPPYEYCDICPDGSPFERLNEIPSGSGGGDPTCAESQYRLASLNAIFEPGTCDDTVLRRSAHYCGCPSVEQQCYLCSDEQPPTNPERGDAWVTQSTCEGIEFLFSLYDTTECEGFRSLYGVDFEHFCKCPGYEKPADARICQMCPGGLANPNFVYTNEDDTFERTCAQAQTFAESIDRESRCIDLMAVPLSRGCRCKSGSPQFVEAGQSASVATSGPLFAAVMVGTLVMNALAF